MKSLPFQQQPLIWKKGSKSDFNFISENQAIKRDWKAGWASFDVRLISQFEGIRMARFSWSLMRRCVDDNFWNKFQFQFLGKCLWLWRGNGVETTGNHYQAFDFISKLTHPKSVPISLSNFPSKINKFQLPIVPTTQPISLIKARRSQSDGHKKEQRMPWLETSSGATVKFTMIRLWNIKREKFVVTKSARRKVSSEMSRRGTNEILGELWKLNVIKMSFMSEQLTRKLGNKLLIYERRFPSKQAASKYQQ